MLQITVHPSRFPRGTGEEGWIACPENPQRLVKLAQRSVGPPEPPVPPLILVIFTKLWKIIIFDTSTIYTWVIVQCVHTKDVQQNPAPVDQSFMVLTILTWCRISSIHSSSGKSQFLTNRLQLGHYPILCTALLHYRRVTLKKKATNPLLSGYH